ncbi:NAD-dependent epimerase/dehydratase family protein [Brevibacillus sp. MS2.2]|uniref:NAD-dependent epimerase/dehydratase family protein n=1 Tax=Brevibacillus sp. MS2.2 TaxID=2738981 RepID=UPI00156AAB8C|nr:NAD-dependent epimerase/dehydratase family protein [Brevibacillus sp. MS2.2]NRR21678.1 NAD-dependent epimerase/dehydratase family protein [Brevibacillus sp. MS2.2]
MKILFLGGTRFIGPHAVKHLAELGHEVAVFNRGLNPSAASLPQGVVFITGDRAHLNEYRETFRSFAPDVVIDLFPYTEADARLLIETFQDIAGRVVAISSCDVYQAFGRVNKIESGPITTEPLTEESTLCENRYPFRGARPDREDYDKVLVERVVMGQQSLPGTILRLPMVYGPHDYQHRVYPYLQQMRDGRPFILLEEGFASWRWARSYVEDIAHAICLVATDDRAKNQIYHVAEEQCLSMREWIERIGSVYGWNGKVITAPSTELPTEYVMQIETKQHIQLDTAKIRRELGYTEQTTAEESMRRTIAWEIDHPPENILQGMDYIIEDKVAAKLGV